MAAVNLLLEIVLFEPEIPANSGNIMRLVANTGARLHLVRPLGFSLSDKKLTRAGMDYRSRALSLVHDDWASCLAYLGAGRGYYALTTKGDHSYHQVAYRRGDILVFGPETRGLPPSILRGAAARLRIPMAGESRSLNLSNAVAVAIYEAWRQLDFDV